MQVGREWTVILRGEDIYTGTWLATWPQVEWEVIKATYFMLPCAFGTGNSECARNVDCTQTALDYSQKRASIFARLGSVV